MDTTNGPTPLQLILILLVSTVSSSCAPFAAAADLSSLFYTTSSSGLVDFVDGGQEIHLALDQKNASGFQSYDGYIYGTFNMRIKLVPGDSAGTVTTYYFSSLGPSHDELDFEFLGNQSGEPIILQTNVYASGVGGREQRIFLWFDPTLDFHNYTVMWNEEQIVFSVDGTPIRVFPNIEAQTGVPYLHNQSMNVYATIWDGDSWATEGGRIKINWTHAPFVASYRDFDADGCSQTATADVATSAIECASTKWWNQVTFQALDTNQLSKLKWVQDNLMVYDYCTDVGRYNVTPPECLHNTPMAITGTAPSSPTNLPSSSSSASSPSSSLSDTAAPSPGSSQSSAPPPLIPLFNLIIISVLSLLSL